MFWDAKNKFKENFYRAVICHPKNTFGPSWQSLTMSAYDPWLLLIFLLPHEHNFVCVSIFWEFLLTSMGVTELLDLWECQLLTQIFRLSCNAIKPTRLAKIVLLKTGRPTWGFLIWFSFPLSLIVACGGF